MVCSTSYNDVWPGSCGSLIPSVQAKIVSAEGNEITGYDQPGELVVKSPSVVLGYLNNETANKETFVDGWMRTGDEAVVRKSPNGYEHVFIVDRIKELIKVKVISSKLHTYTVNAWKPGLTDSRACKLPLRSSRPICSLTPRSLIAQSFLYAMTLPVSARRPTW